MHQYQNAFQKLTFIGFIFTLTACQMPQLFNSSSSQSSLGSSITMDSTHISSPSTLESSNTSLVSDVVNSSSISSTFSSSDRSSSLVSESSSILSSSVDQSETSLISSSSLSTSLQDSSLPTYEGYYASLQGKSDLQLFPTLTSILRSILDVSTNLLPSQINYGNARYDIPKFDQDPQNSSNVILVYSQSSVAGTWDGGSTWNREHVYPQSLMGVETSNSSRHKGADYHNLKPETPSVNSSRGNKYFAESTTTSTYAPPAQVRGDIARILFYMVTMWPELSLVDVVSGDPAIYTIGQLTLFVKWHEQDPVDTFESNRNEVIYGLQGNRNPYIDHQELVCRIWGNRNVTTQGYCAA